MELWFEAKPLSGLNGMQRVFPAVNLARPAVIPAADVIEDVDGYRFYIEMPGLNAESVMVRAEDGSLVIEADRKRPEWSKEVELHLSERQYGPLRRTFRMPDDASQDNIRAAYKDGVLEVSLPKRPETKPVRIKVEYQN
jgi:HSP20 family protein